MDITDHKIHRHCFVGGEEEYIQWSTSLLTCNFGISPVTVRNPETMRALSSLENCRRLLLETDSAYLTKDPWCVHNVSKGAKFRNRYNQVPHLTQDTNGKVTNSRLDTTNESQEVSPFPAGDHKAHINRRAQRQ